jgi:hypothetical protein
MERIISLLDKPCTRYAALHALCLLAQYDDVDVFRRTAGLVPRLVNLIEELPDDLEVNERALLVVVLAASTIINDKKSAPSVAQRNRTNLDVPSILRLVLRNIRVPGFSLDVVTHAFKSLSAITGPFNKDIQAVPSLVSLLVSGLRSSDVILRCRALGGVLCLMYSEDHRSVYSLNLSKLLTVFRDDRFPQHLKNAAKAHGISRCEMSLTMQYHLHYQEAMIQYADDHDLYTLGQKLSQLVLQTENAIVQGAYQALDEETGRMRTAELGIPFEWWLDALPHCAQALCEAGSPADLDRSDILQCEDLIRRDRLSEALAIAKQAIARSPQVAYFYFAITRSTSDATERLKASKKGLKCTQMTPYVKIRLLRQATTDAANMGISNLQLVCSGEEEIAEYVVGIALLTSALEDAKTFLSEAPPDTRFMDSMVGWYVLLNMVMRGPEISLDLEEFKVSMSYSSECLFF